MAAPPVMFAETAVGDRVAEQSYPYHAYDVVGKDARTGTIRLQMKDGEVVLADLSLRREEYDARMLRKVEL